MFKTSDSPSRRRLTSQLPAGILFLTLHAVAQTPRSITPPPVAPVRPVTDTYFGQQVIDPYRYLEDQKSPEVVAFMRGQADYTRAVLDSIPGRPAFAAEMSRYMNAEEAAITDVKVAGPYLFYRKRKRGENQASLYVRMVSGDPERMLLDLPKLSTAASHVSLDDYTPSDDGKFVTADLSPGGSEVKTAHIYETATGRELPETFERCEGAVFSADDKSLFYLQLEKLTPNAPPTDKFRKPMVRQHILGTPVTNDAVVLGRGISPDIEVPEFSFPIALTVPGSRFAFAVVTPGVDPDSSIYVGPHSALTTHTGWQKVADFSDKVTDEALHGDNLYLVSFDGTLNGKILRVDAAHPNLKAAEVVLPESDLVLSGGFIGTNVLHAASDALYIRCLQNGIGRVLRLPYGPVPKPTPLPLPGAEHADAVATALSVSGAVIDLTSWTMPGDDFRYDSKTASLTALHLKLPNSVDPTDLVSEEVTIKGLDGTPLPLSIVYKKGLVRDGTAPTALIGYGAYGDALAPGFGRRYMAWLERGGVLAIAHVRGGGELGEGWHLAGKKLTKANTWRDFIASAQYLIDAKYTSTPHLGIWSQSAGGVLIGRSITERPDLFAAAVDGVPCSDMLREETGANGPANIPEFGSVKDPDGFKALFAMAAYEHIVPGTKYPATLVTAGANDPRVDPWEGAKMASRLQAANAGPNPILFRVNYDAGHGITDTIVQQISDWTDTFTFFLWNFGNPDFQPAVLARSTKTAAYTFGDQPYSEGER
jgi:prolyl oligopeptidase